VLALLLFAAGGALVGIAALARQRSQQRLAAEATPAAEGPALAVVPAAEPPDPLMERLLAAAAPADASVRALDAAAHALLVRERFEEADALVQRTLGAFPNDAEAAIHDAVLRGVAGETAAARQDLERLSRGPAGWEASLFSAGFALRDGDESAALQALRRFSAEAPPSEITPALRAQLAELESHVGRPQRK